MPRKGIRLKLCRQRHTNGDTEAATCNSEEFSRKILYSKYSFLDLELHCSLRWSWGGGSVPQSSPPRESHSKTRLLSRGSKRFSRLQLRSCTSSAKSQASGTGTTNVVMQVYCKLNSDKWKNGRFTFYNTEVNSLRNIYKKKYEEIILIKSFHEHDT